jgi:Spy/CpxP family protein refolding chaperone
VALLIDLSHGMRWIGGAIHDIDLSSCVQATTILVRISSQEYSGPGVTPMTQRISKFVAPALAALVLASTAAVGTNAVAQSKSSKKSASSQKKSSSKRSSSTSKSKTSGANGNRLPAYYGQVDLKDEQREEIYDIQNGYKSKIEKLEKELADLKTKMNKEMEGVLTRTQKSKLKKLRSGSSSSKSKSSTKSSSKSKSKKK